MGYSNHEVAVSHIGIIIDFTDRENYIFCNGNKWYNEKHNMASIRIFQRVDDLFIINTPHIIDDIYELNLIKTKKGEWKIYSMYGKQ